jgi:uncharacterized protein (DUF1684 family)
VTSEAVESNLALADWRRQVAALYAAVRSVPDPQAGWQIWRAGRERMYRDHPQSPLRGSGAELPAYYPYDRNWRRVVDLVGLEPGEPIALDLGADGRLQLQALARTAGLSRALPGELTLFRIVAYGGGLFLPFRDATSSRETYAGGRYVLDTIKGADLGVEGGRLVVDFNFSYFPSCAYSDTWVCPLAPAENTFGTRVAAGERWPP